MATEMTQAPAEGYTAGLSKLIFQVERSPSQIKILVQKINVSAFALQ